MDPRSDCEPAIRLGSDILLEDGRTAEQSRICRPRPCNRYLRLGTPEKTSQFSLRASAPAMNLIRQSMSIMGWLVFGLITLIPGASVLAYWSVYLQHHRTGYEST
ncbi:unnamed protein product [Schistocephalus solidus]|uniref:Uncharacterized protein n=1 Tax=Schistocephalus solidus TaxID=70667 RepID=A0A183TRW6_SCHSO|nr:unnamed protein product [Schistocephalus solidus]